MKLINRAVFGLLLFAATVCGLRAVEPTWNYAVQVSASVQTSPARITLSWPQDTSTTPASYTVYRKSPGATSWGNAATLSGSTTSYTDTSITAGTPYEYQVVKNAGGYTGYGYIQAGVGVALNENRGKVLLLVDSTQAAPLANELARLEQDLVGDGWTVLRHDVSRTASVASVKNLIVSAYNADPANVKSVFLFGRIPVPYSGQLNPDGHPDHVGAWPADVYYGDVNGSWTDNLVNYTQTINTDPADRARISNVPGDGKFDQTTIPSAVELQVGRVDLSNMPGQVTWGGPATFPNETELLRQYLNKDHAFRHRTMNVQRRAVVGDYFGVRNGEAFAASAFRSFAPLVGSDRITNLNVLHNDQRGVWVPHLANNDYLLGYGTGAGSYQSIAGLGNVGQYNDTDTAELVSNDIRSVFTFVFGSWHGDWDTRDNIMRGVLATRTNGLASGWSGRPHWFLHPMGLGETIGYAARLTQNNAGLYRTQANSAENRIHVALMGDPTLRLDMVAPVSSLGGSVSGSTATLTWAHSADNVVGYHVYRANSASGSFSRLTSSPVAANYFADNASSSGAVYMVRAVKLENNTSGSYYNASQGVFWSVGGSGPVVQPTQPAPTQPAPTEPTPTEPAPTTPPASGTTVTVAATDATAVIGSSDHAVVTFTRSGSTSSALTVKFRLTGTAVKWVDYRRIEGDMPVTATIPAGATSAKMTIAAFANVTNANPARAIFTLESDSGYSVGSNASATITLAAAGTTPTPTPVEPAPTTPPVVTNPTPTTPAPTEPTPTVPVTTPPSGGSIIWFDDSLPKGASGTASGGDSWNWVSSSPAPYSGGRAHQSALASGLHEHAFNWAEPLTIATGDTLFTYVYLDPANPPTELMLSWVSNNWEHRAYWGANSIGYGTNGTDSRRHMGALPATGQWVRLEVPAKQVGLEGHAVTGMAFSLFGGRATWDLSGTAPASLSATPGTGATTVTVAATDATAAIGTSDNAVLTFTRTGDTSAPLTVNYRLGGTAVKWVDYRRIEGDMPVTATIPAGATSTKMTIAAMANVTKASPATAVFTLESGSGYSVGSAATAALSLVAAGSTPTPTTPVPTTPTPTTPVVTNPTPSTPTPTAPIDPVRPAPGASTTTVWFDDALPKGAGTSTSGGDSWNWVNSSPAPYSGNRAHQSSLASGLHEHAFNWAEQTMAIASGDVLVTYVYLDPANPPTELMLSWLANNWEHRAYWGANSINYGTNGTASRRHMGALPAAGQWVRLEVPASQVGLEGQTVTGMSFSLFGGRATWDYTGKATVGSTDTSLPVVLMNATDANAVIGSDDHAVVNFTRNGSKDTDLTVEFTLSGSAVKWIDYRRVEGDMPVSVTIPAGQSSTVLTIKAVANVTNANPARAVFTLASSSAYTLGTSTTATVNLLAAGTTPPASGDTGGSSGSGDTVGGGTSGGSGSTPDAGSGGNTGGGTTIPVPGVPAGDGFDLASTPPASAVDYTTLTIPQTGSHLLHVLSPTTLELVRVNRAAKGGVVDSWNFVDSAGNLSAPATGKFSVTVNGQSVAVQQVGFKRRPLYAPLTRHELLLSNSLILTLASGVAEGQTVEVRNADGSLWPSSMEFKAVAHPLRYSPSIHVNQEGYRPGWNKTANIGQYLGNLGEMSVDSATFSLVSAADGREVFTGNLTGRVDVGWSSSPAPYQKVYEADFTAFNTPGEYLLVVPGLGASLPFVIDDGIGMNFARTYALGLYGQRDGAPSEMPFTRFTHRGGHTAPASIPSSATAFPFTWTTIADYANKLNSNNPAQIAPKMISPATQLFPFVNQGTVDVSGGHFDAGDYSKYTINSASLVHFLMFAVDSLPNVSNLDNLGLPESGDGISDVMQEAKWEADFLAKMQDADGGFYFLVYPRNREYESNVMPDAGDEQVVWPKTTSSTAAAVAALAEIGSSPRFKQAYPAEAARYLQKAELGWQFLTNAIARYGKAGSYQKLTHYGDDFTHDDELAWAAAAMYAATGNPVYQQSLMSWFNPADPLNRRWGWWHAYMGWGNAERTYAFAARSGRLAPSQLDAVYLAKIEAELMSAGNAATTWSQQSAYGTSFPYETKRVQSAGWYFSGAQTLDITVAYQLQPKDEMFDAILRNMNYEAGNNPVNVAYVTGLGWKRQQEIVHQYAQNDERALPLNGIPLGNIQTGPIYTGTYGTELASLVFPRDSAGHAFMDRWSDTFNVTTEFVHLDQARALVTYAFLGAQTPSASSAWRSAEGVITGLPETVGQNQPITVTFDVPGMDLSEARIVWEARGNSPAFGGRTFTFTSSGYGPQWVDAEAQWADGRRVVATATVFVTNGLPTVSVVATDATASLGNGSDTATWTFTREGDTSQALTVDYVLAGSAVKWVDYRRLQGDMPQSVTIPAGATSATVTIYAVANSTGANPQTVALTLSAGSGYNVGAEKTATVTIR